jgi:hypothetical protein
MAQFDAWLNAGFIPWMVRWVGALWLLGLI